MDDVRDEMLIGEPEKHRPVLLFVVNIAWFFISHRLQLALAAKRKGFSVHVATGVDDPADASRIRNLGLVLHELPVARGTAGFLTNAAFVSAVWRTMRTIRPSVVHNVTLKPIIVGGVFARLLRIPAVVNAVPGLGYAFSARGWRASARRLAVRVPLSLALRNPRSTAIFQNPEDLAYLVRSGVVATRRCVLIRGAGVDPAQFLPAPEPEGPVTVVLISRMLRAKGVCDFVDAAQILRARKVDVRMVLVGDTDDAYGAVPRAQLEKWSASGVVSWLGHRDDVPLILAAAHIVCLPTYYGEGVPRVLIEAASTARPIVATNVPGVREIVRDGLNGILIEPHRPDVLADAIAALANDAARRTEMGARGRQLVIAEFDLKDVIARTLDVYQSLLANGRRRRGPTP